MNQVFAGGLALFIAFILWSSKRKKQLSPFFNPKRNSFSNKQETSTLVHKQKLIPTKPTSSLNPKWTKNISTNPSQKSIATKKELTKLISSNPDDRLLAIKIAAQWDNTKAIPFLRRGLKDYDSRVVIAAAAAISTYKRRKINLKEQPQKVRPPRNVSLIR